MPLEEAQRSINEQVERGQELLDRCTAAPSKDVVRQIAGDFQVWSDYSAELLPTLLTDSRHVRSFVAAQPYIADVLSAGLSMAQAVVVLLTPGDDARSTTRPKSVRRWPRDYKPMGAQ